MSDKLVVSYATRYGSTTADAGERHPRLEHDSNVGPRTGPKADPMRGSQTMHGAVAEGQKTPFTSGYSVIGEVDAIGDGVSEVKPGDRVGALTVTGGYTEVLYWHADRLIPVPATVDPARAVPLIPNYIVAGTVRAPLRPLSLSIRKAQRCVPRVGSEAPHRRRTDRRQGSRISPSGL